MPSPPLLLLQDITLTFGTAPLLAGSGLAVSAGDRVCLVGRNGSGKSTLLRIAAGLVTPDGGRRFIQPGSTIRYLPQEPDLSGFANVLAYAEAGLGPDMDGDRYRARYLLEQLGLTGEENPATLSGGEARRAGRRGGRRWRRCWRRRPISCCWTNRPTIWTCRASSGWSASCPACAPASS
jgi:ATP-binding cassette subfamily F protein uup